MFFVKLNYTNVYIKFLNIIIMEQTKKSSFPSLQNQEKVLLCVIAQKRYQQLIPMIRSGYKITPILLETLKWSGQRQIIFSMLAGNFAYDGEYNFLLSFFSELLGEAEAAEYIVHMARQKTGDSKKNWLRLMSMLSNEQLEKNSCWSILADREVWEILEKNSRFDEIILSENVHNRQAAANILFRRGKIERIIELGKFDWFKYIPDGEEVLLKYGQFTLLYSIRQKLNWKQRKEMFNKLCETHEGRCFLYRNGEYQELLTRCHFEQFRGNQLWALKFHPSNPENVDWKRWIADAKENNLPLVLENIYQTAANSQQWQLLAEEKQHRLLWTKQQFAWWWKSLTGKISSSKQHTDKSRGCLSFGEEEF